MSWINTLGWWQWLLMLSVPPLIIMLYFLKLRRTPIEVPSTFLWRRTIEDLHVNSIWQRLRRNLLLLLQLLAVLAIILACLRPGYRGEETLGARSIFLIDNSASMQATDVDGSRLEEAKAKAREMVGSLESSDAAMVIAFSDRADVRHGFTSDKRKLREAIDAIQPTNRLSDLNEALRAAAGLANPGRTSQVGDTNDVQVADALPATLYILSDGGFGNPQTDLGNLSAEYIPIGLPSARNVSITAFTVERNPERPDRMEAFARIENFSEEAIDVQSSLYLDKELLDARNVSLEPFSNTGISFSINALENGELRLELDVDDDLKVDNEAFAGIEPPKQLEIVFVSSGNSAIEAALATPYVQDLASVRIIDPESLFDPEIVKLAQSGQIDLFIYDGCGPEEMPKSNTLFLGSIPPGEKWQTTEEKGPLFIIDTNRSHPIMQYVDMGNVNIVNGVALTPPEGAAELLRSDLGILACVAPREAYQDAVLGMRLFYQGDDGVIPNTDWPRKRSFPVFFLNCVEYLGGAVSATGTRSVMPGNTIALNIPARYEKIEIEDPTGKITLFERHEDPQVVFQETEELGFYKIKSANDSRLLEAFSVNMFSGRESRIVPAPEVSIGAQEVEAKGEIQQLVRVEYWRWLLAVTLVLLSLEWFLYTRRVSL
ncbi:MAG: BatA and WFA domain-containing protein [Planctomycetales bacterium]|nr:BatA and WFA domain-containing protein [Planctomycetales bacterium]